MLYLAIAIRTLYLPRVHFGVEPKNLYLKRACQTNRSKTRTITKNEK
jgi:hypothetical protein